MELSIISAQWQPRTIYNPYAAQSCHAGPSHVMQIRKIGLEVASRGHEVWVSCNSVIFSCCIMPWVRVLMPSASHRAVTESELPLASWFLVQFLAELSDIDGKSHLNFHNATVRTYNTLPGPDLGSGNLELRVGTTMTHVSRTSDMLQLSRTCGQGFLQ